jgi:serpin B
MTTEPAEVRDDPAPFRADHPFVFAIRDTKSGAFLFMGRVADPTA